jgi:hypothetical protein
MIGKTNFIGCSGANVCTKASPVVAYVMFVSNPPYGDAFVHTFAPEHPMKLVLPIITLANIITIPRIIETTSIIFWPLLLTKINIAKIAVIGLVLLSQY